MSIFSVDIEAAYVSTPITSIENDGNVNRTSLFVLETTNDGDVNRTSSFFLETQNDGNVNNHTNTIENEVGNVTDHKDIPDLETPTECEDEDVSESKASCASKASRPQ